MASKKSPPQPPATKTVFARIPAELHKKLARMAARASVKAGERVTMQDVLSDLVAQAKEAT